MAAPAYTDDLTDIDLAESATNWDEYGASGWTSIFSGAATDTDDFVQNSTCISSTVKTGVGGIAVDSGSGITLSTDDAVLIWAKWDATGGLTATSSGGIRLTMGSSRTVFYGFDQSGADELPYGMGWRCYALGDPDDSEITADYTVGGITSGFTKQYFGWAFNASSVPSKGNPYKIDAVRYGRCQIQATAGDLGNGYATFTGMAQYNDYNDGTNGYNRLGLFQDNGGAYLWKGLMTLGTSGTAVDFRDANFAINIDDVKHVTRNFNKIEINNASSRVDWISGSFASLSTQSPGRLEVVDNADVNITGCVFTDMDTFIFQANSHAHGCTFNRCYRITQGGAELEGCQVLESRVAADEGAVFVDETISTPTTLTELDNMTISKGTNAHHAIRFGTGVTSDITLTGIEFTGFGTTDDANDSTFRFDATSGSLDLNLVGCTVNGSPASDATISIDDAAGVAVTLVIDPVTTKFTVENEDMEVLVGARVFVETGDNGGGSGLPYQAAVSTLTQTAGTATLVAGAAHGLVTGDQVVVRGAQPDGYNKVAVITVTNTTTFTYSVDSGLTGTATGSPVFSYVPVHGTTNTLGTIQSSKTWPASQSLVGWARLGRTTAPFYSQANIAVNDASGGTDLLVVLPYDQ